MSNNIENKDIVILKEEHEFTINLIKNESNLEIKSFKAKYNKDILNLENQISSIMVDNNILQNNLTYSKEENIKKIKDLENLLTKITIENKDYFNKIIQLDCFVLNIKEEFQLTKDKLNKRINELELDSLVYKQEKTIEFTKLNEILENTKQTFGKEKESLNKEIKNLNQILLYKNNQEIVDLQSKRIKELEEKVIENKQEIEVLHHLNKNDKTNLMKDHGEKLNITKENHDKYIIDLQNSLNFEKINNKKIKSENYDLKIKIEELLLEIQKSKEDLKNNKIEFDRITIFQKSEIKNLDLLKEKIISELKDEREKIENLNIENLKLFNKKNEQDIFVLELKEKLEKGKKSQNDLLEFSNKNINELKKINENLEKKISILEKNSIEDKNKFLFVVTSHENKLNEIFKEEKENQREKKNNQEYISELENEIVSQRKLLLIKTEENENLVNDKVNLKQIIERLTEDKFIKNLNKKNIDIIKLNETTIESVDFDKIKEDFIVKINLLEYELENEKKNLNNITSAYEIKINELNNPLTKAIFDNCKSIDMEFYELERKYNDLKEKNSKIFDINKEFTQIKEHKR